MVVFAALTITDLCQQDSRKAHELFLFERRNAMDTYKIEAWFGPPDIRIKNEGWRVYCASYTSHYKGRLVRRQNRVPRWKLVEVFETESKAKNFVQSKIAF